MIRVSGIQWVSTRAVVNAFFSFLKDFQQSSEKSYGTSFQVSREQYCDFRVAINKTAIKVGKPEEGHYVLDFLGLRPVLDGLDFVLGHCEAVGRQHISQIFTRVTMELALVGLGV